MKLNRKIAFIGNSLPRRCGIATFTDDIQTAIQKQAYASTAIIAMTDNDNHYDYPSKVEFEIQDKNIEEYIAAAEFINSSGFDLVSLQHEFGIFGGAAGENILILLERLDVPIVTTFHTILAKPMPKYAQVFNSIIKLSDKLVVMSQKGCDMLVEIYGVPRNKIEIIYHGIPDLKFIPPEEAKQKLGFGSSNVVLTFGLLSPNKGIEFMIDAMPKIIASVPDTIYVVLGATHPNLVRESGETYRQDLKQRAHDLDVSQNLIFIDEFVNLKKLVEYLSACDVYVTPYLNEAQMTSGTLAYSFGLGNAVVSTPYWHASELLADGKGIIVPFGDSSAIGNEITALLIDTERRNKIRKTAFIAGRKMIWSCIAQDYMKVFEKIIRTQKQENIYIINQIQDARPKHINANYFNRMCDDTGIMQHAIYTVPDRAHGYCVDDNARALLLCCSLNNANLAQVADAGIFAAFVQHAWNKDKARFRNFMSFSRNWLEETGSEDSHGRTLWALGHCAHKGIDISLRNWAMDLFADAYKPVIGFTSPRALAFTLLGLAVYPLDKRLIKELGARLMFHLEKNSGKDWYWFEKGLSYENARLAQALILAGNTIHNLEFVECGLKALRFLITKQVSENGDFRPYGTEGFFEVGFSDKKFDQQPVEAQATISACLSAYEITQDEYWRKEANRAFDWFYGKNDTGFPLINENNGSCFDGLHKDGVNENCGAESVLAYLISICDMHIFAQKMPVASIKEHIDIFETPTKARAYSSP